ncbi:MAG: orotate phosphoribosyltransferase [Nitrospinae bacterium]|nr:orotate phosphoribosyltransferase [Nitrospinota bacterium]MBL7019136.1 orotate phosphoribosyltransferase [Nitrospinaceae bacterium]
MTIAENIAQIALEVGAIRINARQPFTWASGYKMPIYNDNRLLLGNAEHRALIAEGFKNLLKKYAVEVEVIAGTATAGIPHATTLADLLQVPLIYVRSTAKSHGMGNKIEGVLKKNQRVLVIEDLVSTGGSAANAVTAIREAGGMVDHCFSIFSYGFPEASEKFKGISCQIHSILVFSQLLQVAQSTQDISPNDIETLNSWQKAPFEWGKKGF